MNEREQSDSTEERTETGSSRELSNEAQPRAIWFPWSLREDARYIHLLVGLIAFDSVSKGVADWLVPPGEADPLAALQFVLRPNHGLGGPLREIIQGSGGAQELVGVGIAALATAGSMWLTRHRTMRLRRRVLLNVGVFLLSLAIGFRVAHRFEIPVLAIRLFIRPAAIVFWMTLWRLVAPGLWKVAVTVCAASVLANGLSEALPPFGVVTDFIQSSARSGGTFNFADAYGDVGKVLLVVAAAASLFRRIKRGRGPSAT